PRCSTKQRSVHIGCRVSSLVPSPSKQKKHLWESSRPHRQGGGEAVEPRIGSEITAGQTNFPFLRHDRESERSPNRVLKTLMKKHHVRCSKAKALVAAERRTAVNVHPSNRRLKVKRHHVPAWSHRCGKKKA